MTPNEISILVNMACKAATRAAMSGHPLASMHWIPPSTASQDWTGAFLHVPARPLTGADTPPWEE